MSGKKPGRKPRTDSEQRNRQVLLRMTDLYPFYDERIGKATANQITRRDLRRYWTLMNHQIRQLDVKPSEIKRVAAELMVSDHIMAGPVSQVNATVLETFALDLKASSLVGLSVADSAAVFDLLARSSDPDEAADKLAELQDRK